ncbi:ArsR/SmtB family transcription factor [Sphingobium yanoikuyae]|uniref:ArsR/SmtB family transcription factor n=1 Tax=Sphingobium yanoikuyae TaxID=13690 RepID=UPI000846E9EB|nr:metalloregulator ArsR/SmtB family transcription factor [Sphingobium yanoikuyae]
MQNESALQAFAALGQSSRLDVFRLLIKHEPQGLIAGEVAKATGLPASTLSTHLAVLERSGLVFSARDGRTITYRVDIDQVRSLVLYLVADCCGGAADQCEPFLKEVLPCC